MEITLSSIQIIELFFRFCAVGQLGLITILFIKRDNSLPIAQTGLSLCLISYILLTAPIENHHYGFLRNILLLGTDLAPYFALWFTFEQLNKNFKIYEQPKWVLVPLTVWLLALIFVFLKLNGNSVVHDVNHAVGMGVLLLIIYLCMSEYVDDLDNRRRNTRLLMVALCCFYMAGLISFEFMDKSIRDASLFGLTNAIIILILVSTISSKLISPTFTPSKQERDVSKHISPSAPLLSEANKNKDSMECSNLSALTQLMTDEVFLQQELTIGKLSEMLALPQHQLRQLINQHLGFSNFSHYLNSYRIPWVCKQLEDTSKKNLPILTLALNAGYGSIAPFNRAFKEQMGLTPKQYRDQF